MKSNCYRLKGVSLTTQPAEIKDILKFPFPNVCGRMFSKKIPLSPDEDGVKDDYVREWPNKV